MERNTTGFTVLNINQKSITMVYETVGHIARQLHALLKMGSHHSTLGAILAPRVVCYCCTNVSLYHFSAVDTTSVLCSHHFTATSRGLE